VALKLCWFSRQEEKSVGSYQRGEREETKGKSIMKKENKTETDFEKLAAMNDEDIDCSDIAALSEEFLTAANWMLETPEKEQITLLSYTSR
jgi:hypothetical protein